MKFPSFVLLIFVIAGGIIYQACNSGAPQSSDYDKLTDAEKRMSKNAVAGLEVAEGLEATLFASEPMFLNPTNIDIDARGRVWVCEAFNYRNQLNPNNPERKEGDRIVILEDTDGDGVADNSKVFYQGPDVNSALGIAVIGNRVIVSVSPNVLVFTDEDGDDVPDSKEVMFTGIGGEQHDHATHAFSFGPDGKLYFNFGNAGKGIKDAEGKVMKDQFGQPVLAERKPYQEGMVFRCDQNGENLEVLGYNFRNNYEVAVDAFGTLWQSDNDDDGNKAVRINYVMEYGNYGFKDALTGADWRKGRTGMKEEIPLKHWHLNDPGTVPNLLQTGAGSPTGMVIYEGDLLPEVFRNQMIHCDAGPNVVRAYPVKNDGAGYSAEIVNLLKGNGDNWFRPSDVGVAPDGSLFIADWYDPGVGGHQMGDTARGRIYRVAPPNTPYKIPSYDLASPEGAIEALKSPNLATRALAWAVLNEAGENAESALKTLWESENQRFRARALWLLSKIPGKGETYVEAAINDENSDVRIAGLRAARQIDIAILPILEKLSQDNSPQVRREVALALGRIEGETAGKVWGSLAMQYPEGDRWYLEALGIGSDRNAEACFAAWKDEVGDNWNTPTGQDIIWRTKAEASIPFIVELIKESKSAKEAERYFRALDFRPFYSKNPPLAALLNGNHPEQDRINYLTIKHMDNSQVMRNPVAMKVLNGLLESKRGTSEYLDLVENLHITTEADNLFKLAMDDPSHADASRSAQLLRDFDELELFVSAVNGKDEAATINALNLLNQANSRYGLEVIERVALDENSSMKIRKAAVQYLGRGWDGENRLVELIKEKKLPRELEIAGATQLLSVWRESYRLMASEVLNIDNEGSDLPPIHELIAMEGDTEVGLTTFNNYCQACHVVNDQGIDFGPNLSEIGSKLSKEALYGSILQPSAGISFGYETYLITMNDGSKSMGYIASETDDKLDLKMAGGIVNSINKSEIKSRELLDQSLMTAGLEKAMSQEELVGLIEYLAGLKKAMQ